jgi:lipoate-protein ligase A
VGAPPEAEVHSSGLRIEPWLDDEPLLAAVRKDGQARWTLRPYESTCIVLGRGSRVERELHLDAVLADGVPVYRRRGGGCAVLLDPGNLIVSVALPMPGIGGSKAAFARLSAWLIEALAAAGAPGVEQRGISDLVLGDRKVGGSAIYREQGLLYYSSTLLVDPDMAGMERWLKHPPREPDYRQGRNHRRFLQALPEECSRSGLASKLNCIADACNGAVWQCR